MGGGGRVGGWRERVEGGWRERAWKGRGRKGRGGREGSGGVKRVCVNGCGSVCGLSGD